MGSSFCSCSTPSNMLLQEAKTTQHNSPRQNNDGKQSMRTQPTNKLYDDLDLTIFSCEDAQQCDQECDDPIAGCMVVKRLVVTVMYYGHLNVHSSADSQAIFMAFINEVYKDILDDYAHLVKKHNNLEAINK
eukprot:994122_1